MTQDQAVQRVASPEDLAGLYGPPKPVVLDKVKADLDRHAAGFLRAARMAVLGLRCGDGRPVPLLAGTPPRAIRVATPTAIEIPLAPGAWPRERLGCAGNLGIGALFIVPGVKETLRAKGRGGVVPAEGGGLLLRLEVEAVFFHCAKAFMRSGVWDAAGPR